MAATVTASTAPARPATHHKYRQSLGLPPITTAMAGIGAGVYVRASGVPLALVVVVAAVALAVIFVVTVAVTRNLR